MVRYTISVQNAGQPNCRRSAWTGLQRASSSWKSGGKKQVACQDPARLVHNLVWALLSIHSSKIHIKSHFKFPCKIAFACSGLPSWKIWVRQATSSENRVRPRSSHCLLFRQIIQCDLFIGQEARSISKQKAKIANPRGISRRHVRFITDKSM